MAKTAKILLCFLLSVVLLTGCVAAPGDTTGASETTEPTEESRPTTDDILAQIQTLGSSPDDNYRVWYEIFVYSYCDSDGNGVGDLNGVRSKLDELEAMGVTGIWLMPIHPSTSYHKYNVGDYYEIDPEYGTMADFDALIADCNARGIKVILDLVVNHTGKDHEWFTKMAEELAFIPGDMQYVDPTICKYFDYYNLSTESKSGYSLVPGTEFYYECQFDANMPDLNLGSEYVRQEIHDIMKFWLDKGVAGFRVDAAKEFYSGNVTKNIEVMSWLQDTAESIKEDVYMVAEVWDNFATISRYYESGFTSIFNYAFGDSNGKIIDVLRGMGNSAKVNSYATALEKADKAYLENHPDYIDAPFLSNHDVGRIYGFVSGAEEKIKLAGAMNLLMSGSAFIYYGEEIGMPGSGNDPSKRAPMYWNAERNNGTTILPPDCSLPDSYPYGSLEEQKADDSSIYNYYRQAIAIRNALPVISHGRTTAETALNVACISAQRKTWNDQECIILMNIDTKAAQVDLSAYGDWQLAASLAVGEEPITMEGTSLSMPACGIAVLIPKG